MIDLYLDQGIFEHRTVESVDQLLNKGEVPEIPTAAMFALLDRFGKDCLTNEKTRKVEGIPFLSLWLKRKNMLEMTEVNLGKTEYLDQFVPLTDTHFIKAQPRGTIVHWIAGNVPTLAMFSVIPSIICRNKNILRLPKQSVEIIIDLLRVFNEVEVEVGGAVYRGSDVMRDLTVLYYPKEDRKTGNELSLRTDARVIWGGTETVKEVKALPTSLHCEDIIFGPKYSFGVFDQEMIESEKFESVIDNALADAVLFNQAACSSPHVLFFEKNNKYSLTKISEICAGRFAETAKRFPKDPMPMGAVSKIINARAMHLLNEEAAALFSSAPDWTVLVNHDFQLEEPVQSRTVFVKAVESLNQLEELITKKVQTIGTGIMNKEKEIEFSDRVTRKGAARCVRFGQMNHYELPWDGMLLMNRLVRFVSMRRM